MLDTINDLDVIEFSNSLKPLPLYSICQNVLILFWVNEEYGINVWQILLENGLKQRLKEINPNEFWIPKTIVTLSVYLPGPIKQEFRDIYDIDSTIKELGNMRDGFYKDCYISAFSTFGDEWKERLIVVFDINEYVKRIHESKDLVELSINMKYLFYAFSKHGTEIISMNYDGLANRFNKEKKLDGILRVIESVCKIKRYAAKKLCENKYMNWEEIAIKLKLGELDYRSKEQFIDFICYANKEVGEELKKICGIRDD